MRTGQKVKDHQYNYTMYIPLLPPLPGSLDKALWTRHGDMVTYQGFIQDFWLGGESIGACINAAQRKCEKVGGPPFPEDLCLCTCSCSHFPISSSQQIWNEYSVSKFRAQHFSIQNKSNKIKEASFGKTR